MLSVKKTIKQAAFLIKNGKNNTIIRILLHIVFFAAEVSVSAAPHYILCGRSFSLGGSTLYSLRQKF
jgi:hypothetical protein